MSSYRLILLGMLVLAGLQAGCKTPSLYSWGHYEEVIYVSYNAPGKMPPERQLELLEADYQKARANNKPVPPGFHAHLGHLYYQLGRYDQARQEFETEKAQFPESAVLMDRMVNNLAKK